MWVETREAMTTAVCSSRVPPACALTQASGGGGGSGSERRRRRRNDIRFHVKKGSSAEVSELLQRWNQRSLLQIPWSSSNLIRRIMLGSGSISCRENCYVGVSSSRDRGWDTSLSAPTTFPREETVAELVEEARGTNEKRKTSEKLWRNFFSDPSQWWDNRMGKVNAKYPDFSHKVTKQALWVIDVVNPPWVDTGLAAMAPGTPQSSIYSWNKRLSRHARSGEYKKTLELFRQMQRNNIPPDKYTFVPVLSACSGLGSLEDGERLHAKIRKAGLETDVFVGASLVNMYAKRGSIEVARQVFDKMPARDAVCYNALILGYTKRNNGQKAIDLAWQMMGVGVEPSKVTFVGILNACASIRALEDGRRVHKQILNRNLESDVFIGSALVDMYGKCGCLEDARKVFREMPKRTVVSWNSMILGCVKCGEEREALELSRQMQRERLKPTSVTFVGLLNACSALEILEEGRRVHEEIIRNGYERDRFVGNSLVDMYAKCGSIRNARRVFDRMPKPDVVTWNVMILGYVKCGEGQNALDMYRRMKQEGPEPNSVTLMGLLNACASVAALEEGRLIHKDIVKNGCEANDFIGSSLVDMYAKCGSIEEAQKVFNRMPSPHVISWNAMILGYVKCGQGGKGLELSRQMKLKGVDPDPVTFVGMLNACSSVLALEEGRRVHDQILHLGLESDVFVGSSLIDMYSKCGSIADARQVFDTMARRDAVCWSAMLAGYAMHGHAKEAVDHFERMCTEAGDVTSVAFISLLSACSHGGLVDEGLRYFAAMNSVYGVHPSVEHYSCVVDLLGRAGRLKEAEVLIETMPFEPNATVWRSLLGASRIHGNVQMGERAAKRVIELDPEHAAGYVLLSNIYAAAGKWETSASIQQLRRQRGVRKEQGRTWIEVNDVVHSFTVGDCQHPQIEHVRKELGRIQELMKAAGYVPDTKFALHDVDQEAKEVHLGHHSEKLAIAFGLMNTPPNTPLRIFKNLRVCGDCHTATKFIAIVTDREIIVRDANRFHCFKNGHCSCQDYW